MDPTAASPIRFAVRFNSPVTGFEAADVDLSGSTVGGTLAAEVTGSGADYTVTVTGMSGEGDVKLFIPAGAATNAAGYSSLASVSTDDTVHFDTLAPTVTINQAASQADPTNGTSVTFAVHFDEPVTGLTAEDVDLTGSSVGGALVAEVTGTGAEYTVTVTGMSGPGDVIATIPAGAAADAAGNFNLASTSTDNSVEFDGVIPTVTIDQAAGQPDPTSNGPIAFGVHFSEPVTGFTAEDVSLAGSTVGGTLVAEVTGSGADYTVTVTGMSDGTVVAAIPSEGPRTPRECERGLDEYRQLGELR